MNNRIHHFLAYLGSLPFVFCAFLAAANKFFQFNLVANFDLELILKSYSILIVSFMSGVIWGQFLTYQTKPKINLFIISNLITLFCWFSFLLLPTKSFLINVIFSFVSLVLIDQNLLSLDLIERRYYKTRQLVSAIVCLSLAGFILFA